MEFLLTGIRFIILLVLTVYTDLLLRSRRGVGVVQHVLLAYASDPVSLKYESHGVLHPPPPPPRPTTSYSLPHIPPHPHLGVSPRSPRIRSLHWLPRSLCQSTEEDGLTTVQSQAENGFSVLFFLFYFVFISFC